MLVPGFAVKQLPIDLTNINNVKYWPTVFQGTGLQRQRLPPFRQRRRRRRGQGRAVRDSKDRPSPRSAPRSRRRVQLGNGLFVASRRKVSLIVDTDGDDKARQGDHCCRGWKSTKHSVDALGLALDRTAMCISAWGSRVRQRPSTRLQGARISPEHGPWYHPECRRISAARPSRHVTVGGFRLPRRAVCDRSGRRAGCPTATPSTKLLTFSQAAKRWLSAAAPQAFAQRHRRAKRLIMARNTSPPAGLISTSRLRSAVGA